MWKRYVALYKTFGSFRPTKSPAHVRHSSGLSYLHNPGAQSLEYISTGEVLAAPAHNWPGRVAVRSVHEDITLTYDQLLTRADALGCALRSQGFEKGDRLGIWSHNNAAWIITLVAALRVGIIPVAINPIYEKSELSFCIKKTGLKGLMIGNEIENRNYKHMINELLPELQQSKPGELNSQEFPSLKSVIVAGKEKITGTFQTDSMIDGYKKQAANDALKYGAEVQPDDGAIIHFTSGTTGDPKAALVTHFSLVNNSYYIGKRNTLLDYHHNVCVQVPIFHALGSVITVLGTLRHGSSLVLAAPTYNVTSNANTILGENCSLIIGTPTMFVDLIQQMRSRGATPQGIHVAMTAGAPCSPKLFGDIQQFLNVQCVKSLYGMTETTACVFQSVPGESRDQVTETVGYLQDHIEVKVVDEADKTVPFGTSGQLLVRGYNTMKCYWDEPEKTSQALGRDGWLRTGDNFTLSSDGYGRIVGRQKDIIVRGGENIAPKEIEDLLDTHADIIETQVIGLVDERLGEEVCAVVRLREGASISADDVKRHLTGRLARFKIPRVVRVIEEFPKTASGKIQKYRLKELVESGKL